MTIHRLFYILGFVLIAYAVISGFSMHWNFTEAGSEVITEYTFNMEHLYRGLILIYFGSKLERGTRTVMDLPIRIFISITMCEKLYLT